MREQLARLSSPPDHVILTYHGIPKRYAQAGDPYATHVERTSQALVKRFGWEKGTWSRTYQSIFGKEPWLKPYTEETVIKLAREGKKRIFVAMPCFTADCLETVDEIGYEVDEAFRHAGGEALYRCPCLNDHPAWIACLETLVREQGAMGQGRCHGDTKGVRS
jgi:protoporphyrin/coproporphyrin ferrochelatase